MSFLLCFVFLFGGFTNYAGYNKFLKTTTDPYAQYEFSETFDVAGYDNAGWSETGTVDEDYTTTVLEGAQSLYIADGTAYTVYTLSGSYSECYVHFMYRVDDATPASQEVVFMMRADAVAQLYISQRTTGVWRIYNTVSAANGTNALANNTTYHVWLYYRAGTGANSISRLWFSTGKTKPAIAEVEITDGSATASINNILPYNDTDANQNRIFDQIIFDESDITSVP